MKEAQHKRLTGGLFIHFKNKHTYKVLFLATNTQTNSVDVVYQDIKTLKRFTRPLSQWYDEVVDAEGNTTTRFTRQGD